jgi:predicted nucleic-acid-binding protein
MKVIVDTNVLLRFFIKTESDPAQNQAVTKLFEKATEIIIPTHVLCELVWVLTSFYKQTREATAAIIEQLLGGDPKLNIREDEVEAGLRLLKAGGDFADGVNAYTGKIMTRGQAVFASFDKQALKLLEAQGVAVLAV